MTSLPERLKPILASVIQAAEASTLGETLEQIAHVSCDLVHARYAALGVPDGRGSLEYFMFTGIEDDLEAQIGHLPAGRGLLGTIMRDREPIRLDHIRDHADSIGFPAHHPHMDRFLGVPIIAGEQLFGMLYLTDRLDDQPFDDTDQWLIETLAGYAALAIAGVRLREQGQRLTKLEERERIGMELHDGVIQSLYAVGMQVELLRLTGQTHADAITPITAHLNQVIEDIRAYILNLKRHTTITPSVRECLNTIIRRLYIPPGLTVQIDADDAPMPFSSATIEAVSQMMTEVISNVVRHAGASQMFIAAHRHTSHFTLTLTDNGVGFVYDEQESAGLGLPNLHKRAHLHGGSVEIASEPGRGTTITLRLPIE